MLCTHSTLNCIPSFGTQGLVAGSIGAVNIVIPSVNGPFFDAFVGDVRLLTVRRGYVSLVLDSGSGRRLRQGRLRRLVGHSVSNVVVTDPSVKRTRVSGRLGGGRVPCLLVSRGPVTSNSHIVASSFGNTRLTIGRLTRLNRHGVTVVVTGGPSSGLGQEFFKCGRTLGSGKLRFSRGLIVSARVDGVNKVGTTGGLVRASTATILAIGSRMTVKLCRKLGLLNGGIPSSCSIINCSGVSLSRCLTPPLASVSRPIRRLNTAIFGGLVRHVGGPSLPRARVVLPIGLIGHGDAGGLS